MGSAGTIWEEVLDFAALITRRDKMAAGLFVLALLVGGVTLAFPEKYRGYYLAALVAVAIGLAAAAVASGVVPQA